MIKIKLKQTMLTEVSARYLMDAFKLPQEFAEMVNQKYRQNGDALIEVFIGQLGKNVVEKPLYELKQAFEFFMTAAPSRVGETLDAVLGRYPAKKKELIELSTEDYSKFVKTIKALTVKSNFPKDLFRKVKQDYRDNHEELIELFCIYIIRYKRPESLKSEDYEPRFNRFMKVSSDSSSGEEIDEVFKKFPNQINSLIELAKTNWDTFSDRIFMLKREADKIFPEQIINFDDGFSWFDLKTIYCPLEAQRMGHCGAAGNEGNIYSLRKGDGETEESYVTIEYKESNGQVYQIKGKSNTFPDRKYWPYVYEFFKQFGVTEDDIQEELALENKTFMKHFSQEDLTYEEELDELESMILPLWQSNYSDIQLKRFNEKYDSIARRHIIATDGNLKPDEISDMFFLLEQGWGKKFSPKEILMKFYVSYPTDKSVEYNLKVADLILDYIENGRVGKEKFDEYKKGVLGHLKYLARFDEEKINAYENHIAKKTGETKDVFSESRKKIINKFKMDHRGYFRYDQNKIRKQESP